MVRVDMYNFYMAGLSLSFQALDDISDHEQYWSWDLCLYGNLRLYGNHPFLKLMLGWGQIAIGLQSYAL